MSLPGRWQPWFDAWASLGYERSRAASPAQAWQSWRSAQWQRRARWGRLRGAEARLLAAAEAACARLGLRYPVEDRGQTAPWHLPERFLRVGPAAMPEHPVVDPAELARWAPVWGAGGSAAQALLALCQHAAGPERWAGVPVQDRAPPLPPGAAVAVCLHLFYPELWPVVQAQLAHLPQPFDLYLSVPVFSCTPAWAAIARAHPRVRFLPVPNRGRDVAPWLAWLRAGVFDRYGAVCKLHGKRSPHMAGGDAWRDELLQALLGSTAQTAGIVAQFQAQPRLGLLGPAAGYLPVAQANGWAKNRLRVQRLARQLHAPLVGTEPRFFAGTMFWFRASALAPLRHSTLQLDDFPLEMGQTEGTVAHALERLVPSIVQAAGHLVLAWPQPLPPSPDPCT